MGTSGYRDLGAYDANQTYGLSGNLHLGRAWGTFSSAFGNQEIFRTRISSLRVDRDRIRYRYKIFNNLIGLDLHITLRRQRTMSSRTTISRASGFGTTDVNVGELTNKGIEILLTATPMKGN